MIPEKVERGPFLAWIRRMGLEGPAALVLEAMGPLAFVGAQAAYLAEPFLGGRGGPLHDLARILEDPEDLDALVTSLREEVEA